MTNLDSLLKSRDISLPTNVHLVKAMVFPCSHVWLWELDYKESWALKNWFCWTVVLEKTLESPWTARRPNQSTIKEISDEYSLEGLMLKLKLQYFGHLIWRTDSLKRPWCWAWLKVREGDDRGWDGWMASLALWTWVWINPGVGDGQGDLACCSYGVAMSQIQLSDWTKATNLSLGLLKFTGICSSLLLGCHWHSHMNTHVVLQLWEIFFSNF